jgi:arylsulfatase
VTSPQLLPEGPATVRVEFLSDGGVGKGGKVDLYVNNKKVGTGRVDKTVPGRFSADETFDIGMDTGSPVSTDYKSPNAFTGTIRKVAFDLGPITPGTRGEIENLERQVKFRRAMSE